VLASWLPHIPAVKARLTSGDGQLGLVLLAMAAGAVVALPTAGWLIGRIGSRMMSSLAAIALCLAMPLPVLSPSLPALVASLALLGACNGLLDVAMNAQAAAGLAGALLIGHPAAGVVGCALVGLGIANVIPVLFSAAARVPGVEPGRALAAVATTGYLGFLAGPPLIGVVAEVAGLAVGLGLVRAAGAVVAVEAGALPDA